MILSFISEFIIQFVIATAISILMVNYFFTKYKILILLLFIPILTILFLFISNSNITFKKLDSTKWKNNFYYREEIAQKVVKSKNLIGKTKEEIINILGKDFEKNNENTIFYLISKKYFLSHMYIKFKNNKAIEVGIITD